MPVSPQDQTRYISRLEADIAKQLRAKPHRLEHSLRVAQTAIELARTYGVDEFGAHVAGLLHDFAKAYSVQEQIEKASQLGLYYGCDLELVAPILHGPIAARELPALYPELDREIFDAIERHTVAAPDMTELDMVIFIADGIEPGRPSSPSIERQRSSVGLLSLEDLFFDSFAGTISYVLETHRFLWPGTVETYNHYVLKRSH